MSKAEPVYKRLDAKELSAHRMELKSILIKHDIINFRAFMKERGSELVSPDLCAKWVSSNDAELSDIMHMIKSSQPYLGEHFQASRNHFRMRQLIATEHLVTDALKQELDKDETSIPLCMHCKHFRTAPGEKESACMQLGSLPGDYACAGWEPQVPG